MTDRILRTFWHRTRRCIVPKTREEIYRAVKLHPDDIDSALRSMSRQGITVSSAAKGQPNICIYDLTEAGRAGLMALMMAEAGA